MTTYLVHIYREMRLVYGGIEADNHEAAAYLAREKPSGDADSIDDCEGETLAALVDVVGDEEYAQSRVIDFEQELQRKAAVELKAALTWLLDDLTDAGQDRDPKTGEMYDSVAFSRDALIRSRQAGIATEPAVAQLLAVLKDLLGDQPSVQHFKCIHCGRIYDDIETGDCPSDDCPSHHARAVIAEAKAAGIASKRAAQTAHDHD